MSTLSLVVETVMLMAHSISFRAFGVEHGMGREEKKYRSDGFRLPSYKFTILFDGCGIKVHTLHTS
jgi:hypothetical protein